MRTQQSKPLPEIEHAHTLLKEGQRVEAYAVVQDVLKTQPDNISAKALRDRIDTEDFREAVVRQYERQDSFEEEDVSPLLPLGIFVIGIVSILVASYLGFKGLRLCFQIGFTTQIEMGGWLLGKPDKYPAHIHLLTPTILFLLSGYCFHACQRYRRIH
jgi:hypothetical protein